MEVPKLFFLIYQTSTCTYFWPHGLATIILASHREICVNFFCCCWNWSVWLHWLDNHSHRISPVKSAPLTILPSKSSISYPLVEWLCCYDHLITWMIDRPSSINSGGQSLNVHWIYFLLDVIIWWCALDASETISLFHVKSRLYLSLQYQHQ